MGSEPEPASATCPVRACGPRAALVEVGDPARAAALADWLRGRVDADDVVPAAASVLVDGADVAAVEPLVAQWDGSAGPATRREPVEVPVVYDGEDLGDVADLWGCSVEEVVRRHTSLSLTSAFCGFAPGFAYLVGLPEAWAVPRLDSPRPRVPAGSVAVADRWCGVYPTASPGGWRLLGRTDATLWDAERDPPALLAPGTPVRFVAAGGAG